MTSYHRDIDVAGGGLRPALDSTLGAELRGWLEWYGAMGVDAALHEIPLPARNVQAQKVQAQKVRAQKVQAPIQAQKVQAQIQAPIQVGNVAARQVAVDHLPRTGPAGPDSRSLTGSSAAPNAGGMAPFDRTVADHAAGGAREVAARCATLEEIEEALASFDGCALRRTANRLCYADGSPNARLMMIGEAPGSEEDRRGKPFVGPSGRLLDRMLETIDLGRDDVWITNVIFWRPPGNRAPTTAEIAACQPFLERQIDLLDPSLIVFVGGIAARTLLGVEQGVTKLRGRRFSYMRPSDSRKIPALVTFHPAYLLRQPLQKKLAWRDMLTIAEMMGEAEALVFTESLRKIVHGNQGCAIRSVAQSLWDPLRGALWDPLWGRCGRRAFSFVMLLIACVPLGAAQAQDQGVTIAHLDPGRDVPTQLGSLPHPLSSADMARYRMIFDLQEKGHWAEADHLIRQLSNRLLMGNVLAQRYLHPTAYRSSYDELRGWMDEYADHPQAVRIHTLARKRRPGGASEPKGPVAGYLGGSGQELLEERETDYVSKAKRSSSQAREVRSWLARIEKLVSKDRPTQATGLLKSGAAKHADAVERDLARWIIARGYFANRKDREAIEYAGPAAKRSGDEEPRIHWTAGLAAWRLGKIETAREHFTAMASTDAPGEEIAAAAFWAARTYLALRRPDLHRRYLEIAANASDEFYGILARGLLGMSISFDWHETGLRSDMLDLLVRFPGSRRAIALGQIGRPGACGAGDSQACSTGPAAAYRGFGGTCRKPEAAGNANARGPAPALAGWPSARWCHVSAAAMDTGAGVPYRSGRPVLADAGGKRVQSQRQEPCRRTRCDAGPPQHGKIRRPPLGR